MESFVLSAGPSWLWANLCDTSKGEPIERWCHRNHTFR